MRDWSIIDSFNKYRYVSDCKGD